MKVYYQTKLGKLYHGDCLEIMKELISQGTVIDATITDPPYGTTNCSWDNIVPLNEMWELLNLLTKEKAPIVIFGNEPYSSNVRMSNIRNYKYDMYFNKTTPTNYLNANKQPLRAIENIMVFYKKQPTYNPIKTKGHEKKESKAKSKNEGFEGYNKSTPIDYCSTERYPTNLLRFKNDRQKQAYHPTQKPLELIKYLVQTYSSENDLILDFTSGSGTLALACEQLNRRWICIEKEKKYCDATVKRLQNIQTSLF